MSKLPDILQLEDGVRRADRASLGRAISLVESSLPIHRDLAEDLLERLKDTAGSSWRIGITGVPGAGKSTFLEQLGLYISRERNEKLAVLAIDPSSPISGGSILGDKTRMNDLARDPNAFIRPSPSSGSLGGVARRTLETVRICEAAGFKYCFIETVGVGQSEALVKKLCDVLILLLITGAGDQLQGIKRGIMELADIILINKADGENFASARRALAEIKQAVQLLPDPEHGRAVATELCSSLPSSNMEPVWITIMDFFNYVQASSWLDKNRIQQDSYWIQAQLEENLLSEVREWMKSSEKAKSLLQNREGSSPFSASNRLLSAYRKEKS
jgi:LAO/AO transport system kinase